MDNSTESGSTVHVLSGVKIASSAKGPTKASDSFLALQFRPAEPLIDTNYDFILSKVTSISPDFSYDLKDVDVSKTQRFMLISSKKWNTDQKLEIALQCQQHGAHGVIIALPSTTLMNSVFGSESKIMDIAKELSRTKSPQLESLGIPILALMPTAIDYLRVSRERGGHLNVQIDSLAMTFHCGEDIIADDLIGHGSLNVKKLQYTRSQLATKYSAYNFNADGLKRCYDRLEEVMDEDTFPLGMEMEAEIFSKCKIQSHQLSRHIWLKYFESQQWTTLSAENAKKYAPKFLRHLQNKLEEFLKGSRIKSSLMGSDAKNLGRSILFLIFLNDSQFIDSSYFNAKWDSIIDQYVKNSSNKEEIMKYFWELLNTLKTHHLPTTNVLGVVVDANDFNLSQSFLRIFRYFEDPPTTVEESLLDGFVGMLSRKCTTLLFLIDIFDIISLLDGAVRQRVLFYFDSNMFTILCNLNVSEVTTWLRSAHYKTYQLPSNPAFQKLLDHFNPTVHTELEIYLEFMRILENPPHSLPVHDILMTKLQVILSQKSYLELFKLLLKEFPVIVSHFDVVENFLKTFLLEPAEEPFQPFAHHLVGIGGPVNDYQKRVVKAFFPPIFKRLTIYGSPRQLLFDELMRSEHSSEILLYFLDECLFYWFREIDSVNPFNSLQSFANYLQWAKKDTSTCILVNVISFSSSLLSNSHKIASADLLNGLKNSFFKLFDELDDITADLLHELYSNYRFIKDLDIAFHFSNISSASLPTDKLQDLKAQVDEWNRKIDDDIRFITAMSKSFLSMMEVNCREVVTTTENSRNRSQLSITAIRRIHVKLSDFSNCFSDSSKRFFLHFATMPEKSVLFSAKIPLSGPQSASPAELAQHLANVESYLQNLCTTKMIMQELLDISEHLSRNDRKPALEMEILYNYFSKGGESEELIKNSIKIQEGVMDLFVIRKLLIDFICGSDSKRPILAMLQFRFNNDDRSYQQLEYEVNKLREENDLLTWTPEECVKTLQSILTCFGVTETTTNKFDILRGFIKLFQNLAAAHNVWNFFEGQSEFVTDEQSFNNKVEMLLSELNTEDYQLVDSFRTASYWVCLVLPTVGKPFLEVAYTVTENKRFLREITHTSTFDELLASQPFMDYITHLFQYGCSGLDSVLAQFKCLELKSSIEFDLLLHNLQVRYFDAKRKSEVVLSADQVTEFEQRLEFIQNEEKALQLDISVHLKQMEIYHQGIVVLCALFEYGHPLYQESMYRLTSEEFNRHAQSADLTNAWLDDLQSTLDTWVAEIEYTRNNNSVLCLLSIKQARRISSLIAGGSVNELLNAVAHLFVDTVSKRQEVFVYLETSIARYSSSTADNDWLSTLLTFFSELSSSKATLKQYLIIKVEASESNVRYTSPSNPLTVKKLLCSIFGSHRPASFQVLWCSTINVEKEHILPFLQRAKLYPSLKFVVVQFNLLNQISQNLMFERILPDKDKDKDLQNLHFVECGPSILKSASWLPTVDALDVCNDVDLFACYCDWYKNAEDSLTRDNHLCFVGPSGSGKSHQIQKLMRKSAKSFIVPITEEFDWNKILPRMSEGLAGEVDDNILLVFQVNIGKLRENAVERWTALMSKIDDLMFQLLILRSVSVLDSGYIINLPWGSKYTIVLELPHCAEHLEGVQIDSGMEVELPTVHAIFKIIDASEFPFDIDDESRLVCKYLAAYDSGRIDQLYNADFIDTDIVFVLDISGSMHANNRLEICKDRLKIIMDSNLQPKFRVGLVLFNYDIKEVPLKPLDTNREKLTKAIDSANAYGGSDMWKALKRALEMLPIRSTPTKRILVALTDGEAYSNKRIAENVNASLLQSHSDVQVIFITIKLSENDRADIHKWCIRNPQRDKLLDAKDEVSLVEAWRTVVGILTVSQIIERGAANITDEQCNRLLDKHMKEHRTARSKFQQVFWVRYMYRRCKILASSESFNTNRDKPDFGKTTMEIMLKEVERVLSNDHQVDWNSIRHEHMVFRKQIIEVNGEERENYSWSILCSNPNDQDPEWKERKEKLSRHGIQVPTIEDMERPDRRVLDSYLAYGIGVDLEFKRAENSSSGKPFDFELGSLDLPDTVLTLDFTIKLLTINERIECGIPCIMQGETGVSKTELVRLLFTLKNGSTRESSLFSLLKIYSISTVQLSFEARKLSALRIIAKYWELEIVPGAWSDCGELMNAIQQSLDVERLQKCIFDELRANPVLDPLEHFSDHREFLNPLNSVKLLVWFVEAILRHPVHDIHWTFNSVNVHAAMEMTEIENIVIRVSRRAKRLLQLGEYLNSPAHRNTKFCIFFDEFNTSSHMGVLKEVITNQTINGVDIASNVVIVAACNPARKKVNFFSDRKQEHGIEFVSGHYQTHPLPPSIESIIWNYGNLLPNQEMEFIKKRLELVVDTNMKSSAEIIELTKLIYQAHHITRKLAKLHLQSLDENSDVKIPLDEVDSRASSALSLRDILRCFKIFEYLKRAPAIVKRTFVGENCTDKDLCLLAIGIVYYLRLGVDALNPERNYRLQFTIEYKQVFGNTADVQGHSKKAMEKLIEQTDKERGLQRGIVPTDGLQENVYVALVCLLAKVPVMVVGPPGSSKTLAISVLVDNARGKFSKKEFFKNMPTLIPLHYQCSRRSTSTQIKEVFERAIDRQASAIKRAKAVGEDTKELYFVFMDEAGLPEEGKESLKVLHYYLENHMNVRAEVGFVAISNHVLDAAKTNRCALLMRNLPNKAELVEFTKGCAGKHSTWSSCPCSVSVEQNGKLLKLNVTTDINSKDNLFKYLCTAFESCISKVRGFLDVFGLRDYMNFITLLGRLAHKENNITLKIIQSALERNFNGFSKVITKDIISSFIGKLHNKERSEIRFSNPIDLLVTSLSEQIQAKEPTGRYIMLIDTTKSDGILRFFVEHVVGRARKLCKLLQLSDFPEGAHTNRINFISQTRFAMERGDFVVLSHCEETNESFYDLFNHHFMEFMDKGQVIYHTNIAIGGDSRRCHVHPEFQCLMHLTLPELNIAPAPFLNRFEKYRITMVDALEFILSINPCRFDLPLAIVVEKVLLHLKSLFELVGYESFLGYAHKQTLESVFVQILSKLDSVRAIQDYILEEIRCPSYSVSKTDRDELKNALVNNCLIRDYFLNPRNERTRVVGITLLAQAMLSDAVKYFVDISLPECLLAKSAFIPSSLIEMVVTKEKFKLDFNTKDTKRIIYTRTTNALVELQAIQRSHQVNLSILSYCRKESQFTETVAAFLNSDTSFDHMLIVIDLCSTSSSMINFVRNKLESVDNPDKGFTIIIHSANIDIRSHCTYDVVFDKNWEQKFIDSFCDTCDDLSWLEVGYTLDIYNISLVSRFLNEQCDTIVPLALKIISERLSISSEAGSALKFQRKLDTLLREKLLNLYSDFWLKIKLLKCDDSDTGLETPASYALLRDKIQSIVKKYATNAFNMSLLKFVSTEMNSMFTRFIFYYIEAIFEDISVIDFMGTSLDDGFINLLIEGLDIFPQPDLVMLDAPIHCRKILSYQEKSFPFFRTLHRFMQVEVDKFVENRSNWEAMVHNFENYIDSRPDLFETKFYQNVENSSLWKLYLEKFVSCTFPSATSLQSRFITFWLDREVRFISEDDDLPSSNIVLLYMTSAIYSSLLQSFCDYLGQFQIFTTEESIQRYLNDFNEDDALDSSSAIITLGFVKIFHEAMLGCSSCEDYLLWTLSVSSLLLKPYEGLLNCGTDGSRLLKKMTAVMTVSSLLTEKQWDVSKLYDYRNILNDDDSELPFSMIVGHFQTTISPDIDLDFITLLVRNTGVRLSQEDKNWIMDEIFLDSVITSPIQWAPLLDILLFGIMDDFSIDRPPSCPSSMVEWVKLVHDSSLLLNSRLESQNENADYLPDFLRELGYASQFPRLADVAFYIIWKWVHTFSASDASITEIHILKKTLYESEPRDALYIKRLLITALDLFIINRWVDFILTNQDGWCEETQRIVADVIGNCEPRERWISYTRRLFLESYSREDMGSLSEFIKQWRVEHCGSDQLLQPWLEDCETQDHVIKLEDFSFQSCLNISRSSNANEDPIISWSIKNFDRNQTLKNQLAGVEIQNDSKFDTYPCQSMSKSSKADEDPKSLTDSYSAFSFVCGLDRLMCIWVLPCMWKFYQWLTDKMMNSDARLLLIEQVLENSDPEYKNLWVKLRVGIRQYISKSGQFMDVDESLNETSIWKLLSVCDHNETHNGLLIDIMAAILQDCKRVLFCADGTSEGVSLAFQHSKSIDKLLQFSSKLVDQGTENCEKHFVDKLNECIRALNHFGIWQRLVWTSETRRNPLLLNIEIQRVRNTIPELLNLRIKPTICTFSGSSLDLLSLSESNFDPIFHSLEKLEIDSLLRSLRDFESTVNSDVSDSLHTILKTVYGSRSLDLPKIFGITDSNQLAFLSSLQYKEVSNLIKYLEVLLKSEKFQFSSKPLELKNSWPAFIDNQLNGLRIRRTDLEFCEEAHRLEALLIEHEVVLLSNFKSLLASVLERFFKSEDDLLKQYPLLQEILAEFSSDNSCSLVCGHYVFLRLKLRSWINSFKEAAPDRTWDWSITLDEDFEPGDHTKDSIPVVSNNSNSPGLTPGTRRRRISQPNLPPDSARKPRCAGKNEHQNLLDRLSFELKNSKLKLSFINGLKSILADNLFLAPDMQRHDYYCKAVEHIQLYEAKVDEYSTALAALLALKPFNKVEVQAFRGKLTELEKTDDPHYKSACVNLDRFESLLSQQRDILYWKTSSLLVIGKLEEEAEVFGVVLDPDLLQLKYALEEDIQILEHGLTAWALDTKVIETLMRACEHFPNRSDPYLLESTTTNEQRAHISNNGFIDKIKTSDDDGTLTELIAKLRKDVQNNPLHSWVHSKALVAVVAVMPSQFGEHRYKLWDYLLDYLGSVTRQSKREVANIIMLVLARIDPKCDPRFRKACLRKLYSAKTAVWMTEAEIECLQSPFYVTPPDEFKTPAVNSPSILKLMDLVGLDHVKKQVEELHKSVFEEKRLNPEFSVIQSHHFILTGNPGTGKTTVAKIIHEFLTEAGIRSSSPFIELSGDAILRMGFDQFSAEIVKAENGVVFIDDAHALSSSTTPDGPAIIELILDFAESHRYNTSIILAENKDENLVKFHSGFASRFPHIFTFDDYTDEELGSIFRHMCGKRQWSCFNEDVVRAAVRRISRHRGRKAFCNARSVNDFFETTYISTIRTRQNHSQTFILADVLGPNPDPKSNFGLKAAFDKLNKMVGLKAVKDEIRHLVDLVTANYYDRLFRGGISLPTVILNRVFLGNPGTGKTTVAKLYGQILKALGLLSDGGVEIQHSKDLIGASDGELHMQITALLERCAGKVLIIDEAIDLFESPFSSEAVNAMVGLLHNYLVDDIAIVLIGYDMKICEKLRVISESLAWRFWLDRPLAFEDYTDDELGYIATDFAASKNLSIKLSARKALIRSVSSQRCLPQFENAGTIIDLMNKAIASLTERDPSSKVLTLEDFGLPSSSSISCIIGNAIRRVYQGGI